MNIGCFGVKMLPRASPSDAPCARRGRRQPTSTTSTASTPPPPPGPPSPLPEPPRPRDTRWASRRRPTGRCTSSAASVTPVGVPANGRDGSSLRGQGARFALQQQKSSLARKAIRKECFGHSGLRTWVYAAMGLCSWHQVLFMCRWRERERE